MRNQFTIHESSDLIEWRIGGRVTREELLEAWSSLLDMPGWAYEKNMLAVLEHDARLSAITLDDIQAFQSHIETNRPDGRAETGARTAIVAVRPEHWSLLQLFNMSFADRVLSEDEVFEKEDDAWEWLAAEA